MPETDLALTRRARKIYRELADFYPYAHCELDFETPLQLLVATILSAQTTDVGVNKVTAGTYTPAPGVPAFGSVAVSLFGSNNDVSAGPGPLAIAGSIGQSGATVTKTGPGFNINGVRVFGAAAERSGTKKASAERSATKPGGSTGGSGRQRD